MGVCLAKFEEDLEDVEEKDFFFNELSFNYEIMEIMDNFQGKIKES